MLAIQAIARRPLEVGRVLARQCVWLHDLQEVVIIATPENVQLSCCVNTGAPSE